VLIMVSDLAKCAGGVIVPSRAMWESLNVLVLPSSM